MPHPLSQLQRGAALTCNAIQMMATGNGLEFQAMLFLILTDERAADQLEKMIAIELNVSIPEAKENLTIFKNHLNKEL